MRYVGIDFSINSPGICEFSNNTYNFTSFTNMDPARLHKKKIADSLLIYKKLVDDSPIDLNWYQRHPSEKIYHLDQMYKMIDANNMAQSISSSIKPFTNELFIGLEGYSYASKGNSFIELISFNSVLRNYLLNNFLLTECTELNITVFSPSEVKKHAGKGNANKNDMFKYFLETKDEELLNSKFYKWILENMLLIFNKDGSVKKPIDDLIDAYFICKKLRDSFSL